LEAATGREEMVGLRDRVSHCIRQADEREKNERR